MISSEVKHRMIQPFWWNNTFYSVIHAQAGFLSLHASPTWMMGCPTGILEILVDVRVEAHGIHVLYSLTFPRLIV